MRTIPIPGLKGQVSMNYMIGIILAVAIMLVLLNVGLSVFSGFNTEGNYNTIPTNVRSTYDLVPTAFGFGLVLVIVITIFGIIAYRGR